MLSPGVKAPPRAGSSAPPLTIDHIRIIEHKDVTNGTGKTYMCYVVAVTCRPVGSEAATTWLVDKRYTDFLHLYENLYTLGKNSGNPDSPILKFPFPHKSLFHNHDARTIDRRKKGFEELLSIALRSEEMHPLLFDFIKVASQGKGHSGSPIGFVSRSPDRSVDRLRESIEGTTERSSLVSIPVPAVENLSELPTADAEAVNFELEFSRAQIRILRIEAKNLTNVEFMGKNDPFVTLAFDKWRGKTKTMWNGGQNVSWVLEGKNEMRFDVTRSTLDTALLRAAAYDDNDISSATLIGQGAITLSSVLTRGFDTPTTVCIDLTGLKKSKSCGSIIVTFELVEHPDDTVGNLEKVHSHGIAFAAFYIVLFEIGLLLFGVWTFNYGTIFDQLKAKLHKEVLRLMFCSQLLIVLGVCFVYLHRFLGFAVTHYLRSILSTPSGGFRMEVSWVSLRLGLDESEIVLKDFVWANPPGFKDSPFFVKIKRLCIRFDPATIYPAIKSNLPIHIVDIELEGVIAYIERDPKIGLNLWACLGAEDQKTDSKIESSVVGSVSSAMKKSHAADHEEGKPSMLRRTSDSDVADRFHEEVDVDEQQAMPDVRASIVSGADAKTSAWGVPFTFITHRLSIRNLTAYAQDYLNARHSSYNNLTAIKIRQLDMKKKELCDYSTKKGYRGIFLDDLVWRLVGGLITALLASNSGSLALLAASAAANNTLSIAKNTTGMATKGALESFHNFNPTALMGSTLKRTSGFFRSSSLIDQDEELKSLGFKSLVGRVISLRNLKRKGAAVESVYCTLSLTGSEDNVYQTYVRSEKQDLTVQFDEKFELGPISSLSQGITIKVFDKKMTRIVTADKLIVEGTVPDLRDLRIVGRGEEVVSWIELGSDTLFEDTGEIQLALKLV